MTAPTPRVYVTEWPQERVLAYFWLAARDLDCRLDALMQLAMVRVKRSEDWDRAAVRAVRMPPSPLECFACATRNRLLYWHHVVAVQHGGDSDRRNLVAICLRCHGRIHPWLEPRPGQERHGWTSVREVLTQGKWINDAGQIIEAGPKRPQRHDT